MSAGKPLARRAIALKPPKKLPRILTVAEAQAILDACTRLRDRFFFALLYESGCRAGEALGLRHEDIAAAEREVSIEARENANGARAKSGGIGSDYVFVNIWAEPRGQAWSYPAVYDLVTRLRAKTGIGFDPHWFRHTAATRWQRRGVASDATFRLRREADAVRAAALPASGLAGWLGAGHAAGAGVLAPGCAGWQDVASRSVALGDQLMRSAHVLSHPNWGSLASARYTPRCLT